MIRVGELKLNSSCMSGSTCTHQHTSPTAHAGMSMNMRHVQYRVTSALGAQLVLIEWLLTLRTYTSDIVTQYKGMNKQVDVEFF